MRSGERMRIQKRDGRVVPYEEEKIVAAIQKANNEVEERDRADQALVDEILTAVQDEGRELGDGPLRQGEPSQRGRDPRPFGGEPAA